MFSNMLSWFLQPTLIFTLSEKFVRLINMCQELRFFFRNWLLYLLLHSDCSTIITSSTCVKKLPWQIYHLVTIDVNNILKVSQRSNGRFLPKKKQSYPCLYWSYLPTTSIEKIKIGHFTFNGFEDTCNDNKVCLIFILCVNLAGWENFWFAGHR